MMRWVLAAACLLFSGCSEETKNGEPKEPAPSTKRDAKPAEPTKVVPKPPATAENAAVLVDACSLLGEKEFALALGGAPLAVASKVKNISKAPIDRGADYVSCDAYGAKGQTVLLSVGAREVLSPSYRKVVEPAAGIGDEAGVVKSATGGQHFLVRVGDRNVVIAGRPDGDRMATYRKLAEAIAGRLSSVGSFASARKLGDSVGGPAVDPCELASGEIEKALGSKPHSAAEQSTGGRTMFTSPRVGCSHKAVDGSAWISVVLKPAKDWELAAKKPANKPGAKVKGHATLTSDKGSLSRSVVKAKGYVVDVSMWKREGTARKAVDRLTASVVAALPK